MIIIGKSPTSISGVPSFASLEATRSARRDEPEPAAHGVAVDARDDGLLRLRTARAGGRRSRPWRERAGASASRPSSGRSRRRRRTPCPRPVRTTTRTASSFAASSSAWRSSLVITGPMALRALGISESVERAAVADLRCADARSRYARRLAHADGARLTASAAGRRELVEREDLAAPPRPSPPCARRRAPCAPPPRRARRWSSPSRRSAGRGCPRARRGCCRRARARRRSCATGSG